MELSTKQQFQAELKNLKKMIEWLRGYLIQLDCDPILVKKLELALEEAVTNVIFHAYKGNGGLIEIQIRGKSKHLLEIEISDRGPKFDPTKDSSFADPTLPLEKRKIGGVGVHLIKQIVDELIYKREMGKNILTFKKKLS